MTFYSRAAEDPGWIAVVEPDGTEVSAGDLLTRVNRLSHALRAAGLRAGGGIAMLLPNGGPAIEVLLAALQCGWYLTPLNWHFTPPELAYILADCGAEAFFADERFGAAARAAADEAGLDREGGSATARSPASLRSPAWSRGSRPAPRRTASLARRCTTPRAQPAARRESGASWRRSPRRSRPHHHRCRNCSG